MRLSSIMRSAACPCHVEHLLENSRVSAGKATETDLLF
jgi:hypothetical protein